MPCSPSKTRFCPWNTVSTTAVLLWPCCASWTWNFTALERSMAHTRNDAKQMKRIRDIMTFIAYERQTQGPQQEELQASHRSSTSSSLAILFVRMMTAQRRREVESLEIC
ncbi:unnamed protein product [Microthlaspi erraticum]|uniref:Uncharacterized protein n=1 Tax=Microthlaspi erraticum TaxID=1685480 RepID=A0A6D2ING3_9BRAS|nr:unnamed protein product [Microthlaspi erraticum]